MYPQCKSSFKCFLHFNLYSSSFPYWIQAFKALTKLSRNKAILEFSGSNGYVTLSVNFECRDIYLIEDEIQNHFSHLVLLPYDIRSNTSCVERNYEEWELISDYCITSFQGKKCSMMLFLSIKLQSVKIWAKTKSPRIQSLIQIYECE